MILCVLGSASKDSVTRRAVELVMERFVQHGSTPELVDLSTEFTQLHDIEQYADPEPGSQTALLRDRVASASAVVLASPVYHGTFSGLLKNALDHLEGDSLAAKPVGILAAGGGPRSAAVACDHLRTVTRALSGWAVPTHVAVTSTDFEPGDDFDNLVERADELVTELLSFRAGPAAAPSEEPRHDH
ncbi:NADPH-dependent FMN reductase [Streptomyces lancefieldiae]|uniref:NADPH-dependent FMN reductase n=1 Tax=Streptomyces lancefieldiae TaxID=3075520 RepID=A0ABU3AJW5_9ACTN|nr:NADPH-dependent FMN reductase [Streptomyces sp. DSM 40712]MDT0610462.1 NADPH-dependent FMN reductase [Streptomyces sp. DSM 40712]